MKKRIPNLFRKLLGCMAKLALVLAVTSVSTTCCFLSYQPDLPVELTEP